MRALAGQPSAPYGLTEVNAGSSCKLELTLLDDDDVLVAGGGEGFTGRYRIDNLSVNQEILDWTVLANSVNPLTLLIPASLNAIQRQWNDFEAQQVTVEVTVGDEVQQQVFVYSLVNLSQGRLSA